MDYVFLDSVQFYLVILSGIGLILLIIYNWRKKNIQPLDTIALISLLVFFSINAATCAFLSCVLNRYQGRVIWLLPLIFIFMLLQTLKAVPAPKEKSVDFKS